MQEAQELNGNKSRYEKGLELYREGKVSIGSIGLFKVSGFEVDTVRMQYECPDHKTRKQTCKHLFACLLFVQNRGKQQIEHLDGHCNGPNGNGAKSEPEPKHTPNKAQETHSKGFDKQATITRLRFLTLLQRF